VIQLLPNIMPIRVSMVEDDSPVREILKSWLDRADGFVKNFMCVRAARRWPNMSISRWQIPGRRIRINTFHVR
jgi:hypothetical protein